MPFSINAGTYTLKKNKQNKKNIVLNGTTNYIIPIYQRPYSWAETQLKKFVNGIFASFWGYEQDKNAEPMFIGTMQLSELKKNKTQHIIDGQQRITTFLILLKVLKTKYTELQSLKNISLDWLSTEVNNGEQQKNLNELLSKNNIEFGNENSLNTYIGNAQLIKKLIDNQTENELFEIESFIKHLLSNVYFVVIETKASLSKTLQIFDAINTTGLDLNSGDIFKIRMYEYLNKDGENKKAFNEISKLYEKIDLKNKLFKSEIANIQDILHIYQFYLIAKYNLPNILYTYGTTTFFDRLFETIFNVNKWEHFRNNIKLNNLELKLKEIDTIIDLRYDWEDKWRNNSYSNVENAGLLHLWWWSRYSRFWILNFLLLLKLQKAENKYEKIEKFTKQLTKLYLIYSLLYQKSINDINGSFTNQLIKLIVNESYESVIQHINNKIHQNYNRKKEKLTEILSGDILYSAKVKNLICRLSALLEEDIKSTLPNDIKNIKKNLFLNNLHIEHIESYNHEEEYKRNIVWEKWKENINSIGNLVVLEAGINLEIKNFENKKLKGYQKSSLKIVNTKLTEQYLDWDLEKGLERKKYEMNKIINYILE
jgi:uncharacterized protein with ParB-like and HNH nuclease domain